MGTISEIVSETLNAFGITECGSRPDPRTELLSLSLNGHSYVLEREHKNMFALYKREYYPERAMCSFYSETLEGPWVESLTEEED